MASLWQKNVSQNCSNGLTFKPPSATIWEYLSLFLIQFLAIVGNTLVILTIYGERRLRTNYYFLVFHLAVCDLTLALFSGLNASIFHWPKNNDIPSSKVLCALRNTLLDWLHSAQLCFMIFIAVLRHRVVTNPLQQPLSKSKLVCFTITIYVATYSTKIPTALAVKSVEGRCVNFWKGNTTYDAYVVGLLIVQFYPPMVILSILYGKICRLLFLHGKRMDNILAANDSTDQQTMLNARLADARHNRNVKTVVVSVIIVGFFGTSNCPFHFARLLLVLGVVSKTFVSRYNHWLLSIYFTGTCVVNPIIYAFGDRSLFAGYKRICGKIMAYCKPRRRPIHQTQVAGITNKVQATST